MSIITKVLKQEAVYWPPQDAHDPWGRPVNTDPVQIKCRWDETSEQFMDKEGRIGMSKAKVMVDRDLLVGGVLWLGDIDHIPDLGGDPYHNDNTWEIRRFDKIPNFRATEFVRIAYL